MQREVGTARGASVSFFGVSTPALPEFDFSLNNQRKTGFLPPTLGVTGKGGPEFSTPFYWNISPEHDATITPRYMERRGLQMMGEGRYLGPLYRGEARGEILPHDDVTGTTRWAYTWLNNYQNPGSGWSSYINVQRASDDSYFRDLASRLSVATQTFLPADAYVNYSSGLGGLWNVMARTQSWQTLQDPLNPVTEPYNRLPQLTGNYLRQRIGPFDFNVAGEFVAFDTAQAGFVTGNRGYAYPSISMPIVRPQGFVTPKIGYQYASYNLDTAQNPLIPTSQTRGLPLASLDTGLFFERDTQAFGRDFVQTLEPRAYYLYVPYRDQSNIPLFDTSVADFNYSQLFRENYFFGVDRIATRTSSRSAMTSRLILPVDRPGDPARHRRPALLLDRRSRSAQPRPRRCARATVRRSSSGSPAASPRTGPPTRRCSTVRRNEAEDGFSVPTSACASRRRGRKVIERRLPLHAPGYRRRDHRDPAVRRLGAVAARRRLLPRRPLQLRLRRRRADRGPRGPRVQCRLLDHPRGGALVLDGDRHRRPTCSSSSWS